jgi:hypothetical protein
MRSQGMSVGGEDLEYRSMSDVCDRYLIRDKSTSLRRVINDVIIPLIRSRCSSELPASVDCRSGAAPVRPRCPETLGLGSSKKADVCDRVTKMG